MEGRMTQGNNRIVGIGEHLGSSSSEVFYKVIREALQMDWDIKIAPTMPLPPYPREIWRDHG